MSLISAKRSYISILGLTFIFVLGACGKAKQPTVAADKGTPASIVVTGPDAEWIRNLTLDQKMKDTLLYYGIETGVNDGSRFCAQLVRGMSGVYQGKVLLQLSAAQCPATGLVDSSKARVYKFEVEQIAFWGSLGAVAIKSTATKDPKGNEVKPQYLGTLSTGKLGVSDPAEAKTLQMLCSPGTTYEATCFINADATEASNLELFFDGVSTYKEIGY